MELRSCQKCGFIGAKFKCHRCKKPFYCGKDCQTLDWKNHKQNCVVENLVLNKGNAQLVKNKTNDANPSLVLKNEAGSTSSSPTNSREDNIFRYECTASLYVRDTHEENTTDQMHNYHEKFPQVGKYEMIILSCLVATYSPNNHDTDLRKTEYYISSFTPPSFCRDGFYMGLRGPARSLKEFCFFTGRDNFVESLNGNKKNVADPEIAIIFGCFFPGDYKERSIFLRKEIGSFYCPFNSRNIAFQNVGIAKCLNPEVGVFTALPFLEYFPILDLSFIISQSKYEKLHSYLLLENHKKEIENLVHVYNERALLFRLPKLSNNIKMLFSDGTEQFNPNCIGWLVGDQSPLKFVNGLEEQRSIGPPFDFRFCKKSIFCRFLKFMLERTIPTLHQFSTDIDLCKNLVILYDICNYLNIMVYDTFLDNVAKLITNDNQ
jgi:hypothetical protein